MSAKAPELDPGRFRTPQPVGSGHLIGRLLRLYLGLVGFGVSLALLVRARLGLDPWDVLHQGIADHTGLAIGTVSIVVGAVVLLGWIPLRQRPGLGTVSNVVLVGSSMNATLALLPGRAELPWRIAEMLGGILLCGLASGMYIGARFGPGPRDGLMTGLARRTGRSLRLVRVCLELTVLAIGWLLGGTVGIGTVLFAVAIGPLVQFFLPLFDTAPAGPRVNGPPREKAKSFISNGSVLRLSRPREPTPDGRGNQPPIAVSPSQPAFAWWRSRWRE
jgi:uncharacterized membrane protein YczE